MRITTHLVTATIGLALALSAGCESGGGAADTSKATAGSKTASGKADDLAGGKKHEPPIKKDAVTAGHYYCDMGTVHYTRPDKGDGKCSLCGMDLKHKK